MFITAFNDKVREALAAASGVVRRSTLHKQVVSSKTHLPIRNGL